MKKIIVGSLVALALGAGVASAAVSQWRATTQAERPAKIVGTIRGTATVVKQPGSPVDRIDIRLIRGQRQMAYRTFLVPRARQLYRASITWRCREPLRVGFWQTQSRLVTRAGAASAWSTSRYIQVVC